MTSVDETFPDMRWSHVSGSEAWNEAAVKALGTHGRPLVEMVPNDIAAWCPAYEEADPAQREAFWVGLLSAMAKHESTYRQTAVSPNGKWFGLLQISPATARGYQCRAGSGTALKDGSENVSCAIRIMAVTVPRDGVISAKDSRWRGVAADWGPMRVGSKRRDMASWLNAQPFCAKS
ncbi:MAG: transglycosylase SLT domain-containing protein [Pseudomonadota bacterium]